MPAAKTKTKAVKNVKVAAPAKRKTVTKAKTATAKVPVRAGASAGEITIKGSMAKRAKMAAKQAGMGPKKFVESLIEKAAPEASAEG